MKDARADKATAINKIVLVKAAQQMLGQLQSPTIPIVCPTFVGKRAPASRSNSIVISKKSASRIGGKGTLALEKIIYLVDRQGSFDNDMLKPLYK